MSLSLDTLQAALEATFGDKLARLVRERGEIAITVKAADYAAVALALRDEPNDGLRFVVVSHLLSVSQNWRVRVKVFAPVDDLPVVPSITGVWNSANWFEREAFDLYGIIFEGHADLRRLLTDYGFIGHPMRKDFPVSGHVEMRYDTETRRVIYQPVTIEPREITPRVIREDNYGGLH